ncbi:hypothetical protein [Prevotella sp. MA2016]|uniref:hypothetical protein n=1 Tax=Prevotella sp. MA2016 TaxID=1408310 RepID=UPI00048BE535|nr:hypothetical protein [Prevotella sp. MA2016]
MSISKNLRRLLKSLYALPLVVIASITLSFACSCSCDVDDLSLNSMAYLYDESVRLSAVSSDSIQRFATKVETYVIKNPAEQFNPLYSEIKYNITQAAKSGGINLVITINTEWEGDTTIYF